MLILSQYWGWCRYHYQEHPEANFTKAKEQAIKVLDSCLPNIIWRLIDAYKKRLTGEAAAWVVREQKSHRSISEASTKALEA